MFNSGIIKTDGCYIMACRVEDRALRNYFWIPRPPSSHGCRLSLLKTTDFDRFEWMGHISETVWAWAKIGPGGAHQDP